MVMMMITQDGGDDLAGHYPHLTDLHQVIDLDYSDDGDDDADADGDSDNDIISCHLSLK